MTASQPACSALTACFTAPQTTMTFIPAFLSFSRIGMGTPRPATKDEAPSSMITSTAATRLSGEAARRSTPKGPSVRLRTLRICSRMKSGPCPAMPRTP